MTRDEVLTMPASEEMDALIAQAVMGWKVHPRNTVHWMRATDDEWNYRPVGVTCGLDRWAPSKHVSEAWQVVERLQALGHRVAINTTCDAGLVDVVLGGPFRDQIVFVFVPMPLGVARAALLAQQK